MRCHFGTQGPFLLHCSDFFREHPRGEGEAGQREKWAHGGMSSGRPPSPPPIARRSWRSYKSGKPHEEGRVHGHGKRKAALICINLARQELISVPKSDTVVGSENLWRLPPLRKATCFRRLGVCQGDLMGCRRRRGQTLKSFMILLYPFTIQLLQLESWESRWISRSWRSRMAHCTRKDSSSRTSSQWLLCSLCRTLSLPHIPKPFLRPWPTLPLRNRNPTCCWRRKRNFSRPAMHHQPYVPSARGRQQELRPCSPHSCSLSICVACRNFIC